MKWYKNLYFGPQAEEKKKELLAAFEKKRPKKKLFLVTLPTNDKNVYDIYSHGVLLQEHYRQMELYAVGLAFGKGEAMELAAALVQEAMEKNGTVRMHFAPDDFQEGPYQPE